MEAALIYKKEFENYKKDNFNMNQFHCLSEYRKFKTIMKFVVLKISFFYETIKVGLIKKNGKYMVTNIYFLNEKNNEIAYITLDMFPLTGLVYRDSPIVWSEEFLNSDHYVSLTNAYLKLK